MRVPVDWLREYCAPELDVAGVEQRLTMTGTKVEAIHRHGMAATEGFVVGRVLACEPHPNADRLRVCDVDLGAVREGRATIVCGAPNVAAGQTVAVALPGATMLDGTQLGQATLRGVVSEGMICSAQELGIGAGADGIMVIERGSSDGEPAPGTPLDDVLTIATDVLELEVTPNRPDCLGVYGVARELHAASGAPLAQEPWSVDAGSPGALHGVQVAVDCPDLCLRFTARAFENVAVAPSPPWLQARLSAAGQRPINNVVDVTNYAMLLTGQPLHAFDLDRVAGARLTVRRAKDGELVKTLDGQGRALDSEMVLIADASGPTSIAGLMGGERSEVGPDTTRVLLEVASWSGPSIHRTSSALGLRSEASARFEKGLVPEQCAWSQAVATRLLIDVCGAAVASGTIDIGRQDRPPAPITLRTRRVEEILGVEIDRARQAEILQALDFATVETDDGLAVTPPPARRADVAGEADLIEEVARIDGLERLPATLPKRRGAYGLLSREQRLRRRAADALVGRGLLEVVGWTFATPALADRLRLADDDAWRAAPVVENPLSEDQSLLRATLLGSLLDTAARNAARGNADLRLFELGTVFAAPSAPTGHERTGRPDAGASKRSDDARAGVVAPDATAVRERRSLAVLLSGRARDHDWGAPAPAAGAAPAGYYAVKGVLEALASALRVADVQFAAQARPFLHPGRAATVSVDGHGAIGWLGELHPSVAAVWELAGASAFEVDLDRLIAAAAPDEGYEDLIGYPPLRQDLAVVLPSAVTAAQALSAVRRSAGELLRDVRVFDVYTGPQLGEGERSLTLALSFRAPDRTLADEEVTPVRARIVAALGELGGELRG